MGKTLGYSLLVLGLVVFLLSYSKIRETLKIPTLGGISDTILLIIGLVVLFVGAFFIAKSSSKQSPEVPIYEGEGRSRKVVGYKRMK